MFRSLRFIQLLLLMLAFQQLTAQLFSDYNFKFKTYNSGNGLVHNSVKKCRSDSKGFLWIITENGLSRFDGYQFKNFQHVNNDSSSLPVNDLSDIVIDKKDRIWLAFNFGVCYYDPSTQEFSTLYRDGDQVPANQIVWNAEDNTLFMVFQYGYQHTTSVNTDMRHYRP